MAFVGSLSGSGGASNTINVTGSMIIANPGTGGLFPSFPGADTVFFVSGAIGGKAAGSRTVSVFGGDVVASGSITVGTGSITITSNEIQFYGGAAKILSSSDGLTFFDSNNTSGKTLTQLAAGSGGSSPSFWFSNTNNETYTTGSAVVSGSVVVKNSGGSSVIWLDTTGDITGSNIKATGDITGSNYLATTLTVTNNASFGGNVLVTGDLTVNGTTVTVDATTLTIEDPIVGFGFTSGSTAVAAGDRGFIGGQSGDALGNTGLIWDYTDSTFAAVRTSDSAASGSPVTVNTYTPFRASRFEIGGTPGSAVTANSAYVSSSDALNVLVNHKSSTTFTKGGTAIVQIADFGGDGMITGNSAVDTIASLWVSGTSVNMAHTLAAAAGPVPQGIKIVGGGLEGGSLRISGSPGNTVLNINSHDGANNAKSLVVSGSAVTINAATSNNTNGVLIQGAGTSLSRVYGSATNVTVDLLGSNATTLNAVAGGSTAELTLTGSNINLSHGGEGGKGITLQKGGTKYGSILYGTNGPTTYAQFGNESGATAVRIGSTGAVNLSGSIVEVTAGLGAAFYTSTSGASVYLTAASGSFALGSSTVTNASKIEATNNNALLLGSSGTGAAGTVYITGSLVRASVGTSGNVAFQRDGIGFMSFSSGSTATNESTISTINSTRVDLFNTVATTVNFAGAATSLEIGASTGTTSINNNLTVDGTTTLGNATGDDISFVGYAASSLIPKTTNAYDLGTPDLRWRNMYTGDLHLKNERGEWTVIEEEEFLTLTNNESGKRYKFVLEEI